MSELIKKLDPRLYPDMNWIDNACLLLSELISHSEFKPERILCIAFGGLVPAAILSARLRIPLSIMTVQAYDKYNKPKPPSLDVGVYTFPKVPTLVVDDITDSGRTLELVIKILSAHEVKVECATLHVKPQSKIQPRYFACKIDGWVEYPWERR